MYLVRELLTKLMENEGSHLYIDNNDKTSIDRIAYPMEHMQFPIVKFCGYDKSRSKVTVKPGHILRYI